MSDQLVAARTTDDLEPASVLAEVQAILAGARRRTGPVRLTRTLLFADVVDSTAVLVELGDEAWAEVLDRFHVLLAERIAVHGGQLHDTAGDGCFASFASAGAALECAAGLIAEVRQLGLHLRIGLHAGDVHQLSSGRLAGLAVHVGARIGALAHSGEVLVSAAVRRLASEAAFAKRGEHHLRGVPAAHELFSLLHFQPAAQAVASPGRAG